MSYERLIAEHARIDTLSEALAALAAADCPDVPAVMIALSDLSCELSEHLAHEDSLIYPRMIAAKNTEMAEAASRFVTEFAALRADWTLYLQEWGSEAIAVDWQSFRAETRTILDRLDRRVRAENELLYPAAFRNGVLALRSDA